MSWKYSIFIRKIPHHEIPLGGGIAAVDLLRPRLDRQLDPERFVDREDDIEEIEAVDLKIVDDVTFRLDLVPWDVACLHNDIGHPVERRRHHSSPVCCYLLRAATLPLRSRQTTAR
jgi:hypothetical protein